MDLETHGLRIAAAIGEGFKVVFYALYNNLSIGVFFKALAFSFIFERAVTFAAPRTPCRPHAGIQLVLRVPVIATVVWYAWKLLCASFGSEPYPVSRLWEVDAVLKCGLFLEYILAIRARRDPFSGFYTYPELYLILKEAQKTGFVSQDMSAFLLLVCWAHCVLQFNGIFGLSEYRLYTTGAVIVPFLLHYLSMFRSGADGGIFQYPVLAFLATVRLTPLLIVMGINFVCYATYYSVSFLGGRDNMALAVSQSIRFPRNGSFYVAWFILAEQAFLMTPDESYMAESKPVTLHQPYLTLERQAPNHAEGQYGFNPISEIIDGFGALKKVFRRRKPLFEETVEPEWAPESDYSESESEQEGEFEAPPISEALELCGQEMLDSHMVHGRMTRAKYALLKSKEYITTKLAKQPEFAPQRCVVCLDANREIVLWPCGCLCICQDCRGALGTQDTRRCICCRGAVTGYSRVFMP